ncbi:MAG: hypothetical protein CR982_08595 [Candidatus Cloacimonadota bacterium]|nr:MAG: hypothetical protein CR982_08595 [Candidatus Cloacimonadota bacterium]PIE78691.1 MAG: hypothetical protein CSA15_06520 [Candidatus Delongbacteria bacterium]
MNNYESIKHTTYDCKYNVLFILKYSQKTLFLSLKKYLGEIFHELAKQKECCMDQLNLFIER